MPQSRTLELAHFLFSIYSYLTPTYPLRVAIPREKRGIEEFDDEEFLTRKTDEENEELTGLKKGHLGKNIEKKHRKLKKKWQNLIS